MRKLYLFTESKYLRRQPRCDTTKLAPYSRDFGVLYGKFTQKIDFWKISVTLFLVKKSIFLVFRGDIMNI